MAYNSKMRTVKMSKETILENLRKALINYDAHEAAEWAQQAVFEGIDPVETLDALTEAIRHIGDLFGRGELWLPDLIAASETMSAATKILEEEIRRSGAKQKTLGVVVIGTVAGDIHDIGKNMVATLMKAGGFEVHDLGINIQADAFVQAIVKHDAQILAMSALLTTTAPQQCKVIDLLKEKGLRDKVKVMVGGGGINADFAASIGADGYDPTAPGAVNLARRFVGQ
jgi:corrinoid protein of di/trimethylamine methyltransferase